MLNITVCQNVECLCAIVVVVIVIVVVIVVVVFQIFWNLDDFYPTIISQIKIRLQCIQYTSCEFWEK